MLCALCRIGADRSAHTFWDLFSQREPGPFQSRCKKPSHFVEQLQRAMLWPTARLALGLEVARHDFVDAGVAVDGHREPIALALEPPVLNDWSQAQDVVKRGQPETTATSEV